MTNPWLKYSPKSKTTVHQDDLEVFNRVNARLKNLTKLSDNNVALPYFGNPKANVVLLYANPGLDLEKTKLEETPKLKLIFDAARKHKKTGKHSFVFLLEEFKGTPGYNWWKQTLGSISELEGYNEQKFLNNIFSVEIHPYKSVKYGALRVKNNEVFPTTAYSYSLVAKAMERGALILIARAQKEWFEAVPGLQKYKNVIYLSSAQQSKISPNNTILDRKAKDKVKSKREAWALLVKALNKAPRV